MILVFVPAQNHCHLLYLFLGIYDGLSQTFLPLTLEFEHTSETVHIFGDSIDLISEGKLQQLNLLQLFEFDMFDIVKVSLQLLDLLFLRGHVHSVISVLEFD